MSKGLYVEVDDQVTGYCPACNSSDLEFTCMTIVGTPTYKVYKYRLSCKKSDVCALRREYMAVEVVKPYGAQPPNYCPNCGKRVIE